jgi:polyisoprenoid-binding protein YceI
MNTVVFAKPAVLAPLGVLALLCSSTLVAADGAPRQMTMPVDGGSVTFDVGTNISAVSVHGKSASVRGLVRARKDGGQLIVDEVNATLPVDALTTGMGLRDEHMKKYIFTTQDHQTPDIRFTGVNVACPMDAGGDAACKFAGKMSIRGVEKPLTISLKVKASGTSYRATGDGAVKLSDYGIERPSQFGVKCADDVKIHIELQGRETVEATASSRAGGAN